ncbi:hypothetical protein [Paenibacillus sp. FSL R10-2736]|uniref:hypothetical protein n=1 Tax=Paenibacillus sp. FSL R10-2736 TaxID=2954692 RepID=UPI0030FC1006
MHTWQGNRYSITAESVPLIHNEEYLLLLRMAMEKSAAGAYPGAGEISASKV